MNKLLLILLFCSNAYAQCIDKPIRIAIVDSGFGYEGRGKEANLCLDGHKDFSKGQVFYVVNGIKVPLDLDDHGTNITGIIEGYARNANANYCIVVLKYYNRGSGSYNNLTATINAFNYAREIGADYINYSSGGEWPDKDEELAVRKFLNGGGTMVVAAGNEGRNLDLPWNSYYPAQYDKRIIVVGMLNKDGTNSKYSNYGNAVNRWEIGKEIAGYGLIMSGTSQATAVATGKIVSKIKNKCDRSK